MERKEFLKICEQLEEHYSRYLGHYLEHDQALEEAISEFLLGVKEILEIEEEKERKE